MLASDISIGIKERNANRRIRATRTSETPVIHDISLIALEELS
jgi:hypothetical protein